MLIALDGPAGSGKSTVARAVAQALGFTYLDTGAMYRCVALAARARGADPGAIAAGLTLDIGERVVCDGMDVTEAIRTPEVSDAASQVAADPVVRDALVAAQRRLIATGDWVAEGRDIATVVAPDAEVQVFLTASASERARRRAEQSGQDPAAVLAEQTRRDERDQRREHGPLVRARDAVALDTTGLSIDEVVEAIVALARGVARLSAARGRSSRATAETDTRSIPSHTDRYDL